LSQPDNPYYQLPLPFAEFSAKTLSETRTEGICLWRCPNCGQVIFTLPEEAPPDTCDYCQDMTTWLRIHTVP
jgi:rubrerythrin